MAEVKREVRTFQVSYMCDDCGKEMTPTLINLLTYPPQYPHRCENGHEKMLRETYPKIVMEEIEDEE